VSNLALLFVFLLLKNKNFLCFRIKSATPRVYNLVNEDYEHHLLLCKRVSHKHKCTFMAMCKFGHVRV